MRPDVQDPSCESGQVRLGLQVGPELGRGTSGAVFPVLRAVDGGAYAVKEVPTDPWNTEKVLQEVRLHKLCSTGCADVVRYAFASVQQDRLLVLMERCDFLLWDALVDTTSQAGDTRKERLGWTQSLFRAVEHCHRLHVLHRDINPWNIFLVGGSGEHPRRSASLRLGDFGLAVQLDSGSRELHGLHCEGAVDLDESALTSLYSAPELGATYGFPADVFSAGMTAYAIWSADGSEDGLISTMEARKAASTPDAPEPSPLSPLLHCPAHVGACLLRTLTSPASRPTMEHARRTVEAHAAEEQTLQRKDAPGPPEGRWAEPEVAAHGVWCRLLRRCVAPTKSFPRVKPSVT